MAIRLQLQLTNKYDSSKYIFKHFKKPSYCRFFKILVFSYFIYRSKFRLFNTSQSQNVNIKSLENVLTLSKDYHELLSKLHIEFDTFKNHNNMEFWRLTNNQIIENHQNLKNIRYQKTFNDFCKKAYGNSFKICLWLQKYNNLITQLPPTLLEVQHIVPRFLTKHNPSLYNYYLDYDSLQCIKFFIEKDYNKILIPYTMHAFIHSLRYIEYYFMEDFTMLGMAKKYA